MIIDRFLGYSSQDAGLIALPALGQDCENVIINAGHLCNIPNVDERFLIGSNQFAEKEMVINRVSDLSKLFVIYQQDNKLYTYKNDFSLPVVLDLLFLVNWPSHFYIDKAKLFSHGASSYLLGAFRAGGGLLNPIETNYPRQVRLINSISPSGVLDTINYFLGLVGILPPDHIAIDTSLGTSGYADSAGVYTGNSSDTIGIAITFVTRTDFYTTVQPTPIDTYNLWAELGPHDIESNAVTLEDIVIPTGMDSVWLKVFLPKNHVQLEPRCQRIGIYIRKPGQSNYYFYRYYDIGNVLGTLDNYYVSVLVGQTLLDAVGAAVTLTISTTKIAKTIGHSIPAPINHICFYKNRIYSSVIWYDDKLQDWPINLLQCSPNAIEEANDSGFAITNIDNAIEASHRIVNYVDRTLDETIGHSKSGITGLVEFLKQLIIFKFKETYVLNDDIVSDDSEITMLFDNIGCVNNSYGQAYIVYNDILYWLAADGVYRWVGAGLPERISEPIQKDLESIDKTQYRYCKFSIDTRYKLLFVYFPETLVGHEFIEGQGPFIYHTLEGTEDYPFVWTKAESGLIAEIVEYKNNTYAISTQGVDKLLTIYENSVNFPRNAFWKSGWITGKERDRYKHFKMLSVETDTVAEMQLKGTGEGGAVVSGTAGKRRLHLGLQSKKANFQIDINNSGNKFRIQSAMLDVHLKGRR